MLLPMADQPTKRRYCQKCKPKEVYSLPITWDEVPRMSPPPEGHINYNPEYEPFQCQANPMHIEYWPRT